MIRRFHIRCPQKRPVVDPERFRRYLAVDDEARPYIGTEKWNGGNAVAWLDFELMPDDTIRIENCRTRPDRLREGLMTGLFDALVEEFGESTTRLDVGDVYHPAVLRIVDRLRSAGYSLTWTDRTDRTAGRT